MGESNAAESIAVAAKRAFEASQVLQGSDRSAVLKTLHAALQMCKDEVLAANAKDVEVSCFPF